MDTTQQKAGTCMACSCPCEEHKEHNHPTEKKVCTMCNHEHKEDGACDCGCGAH